MSTLLLRLAGPMQSWGTQSRFLIRDSGREPSKSGVVGLLCAALGWGHEKEVDHLAKLQMGVRVDHEGNVARDYQTAGGAHLRGDRYGVPRANASGFGTVVSTRYYLADADFLVGLAGDEQTLRMVDAALFAPHWQLFLGRKAFVPGVPVHIPGGMRLGLGLPEALNAEPWPRMGLSLPPPDRLPARLRFVLDSEPGAASEVRFDLPYGAAFTHRRFGPRYVATSFQPLGDVVPLREDQDVPVASPAQP